MARQFREVRRLGAGAWGEVYLVEDDSGSRFARKTLSRTVQHLEDRVLNEILVLSRLDHPNVVKVEFARKRRREVQLYMEYCDGGDLLNEIENKWRGETDENDDEEMEDEMILDSLDAVQDLDYPIPPAHSRGSRSPSYFTEPYIWHVICCISAALSCCHYGVRINKNTAQFEVESGWAPTRRVVHRDIKPSNILIANKDQSVFPDIKVGGFGSSTFIERFNLSDRSFSIAGTQKYWAPEVRDVHSQYMGDDRARGAWTVKADIWSLGCTIFRMMVLDPAVEFSDDTNFPETQKYSEDLRATVLGLLSRNPSTRPSSVEVLRHALGKASVNPFSIVDQSPAELERSLSALIQSGLPGED